MYRFNRPLNPQLFARYMLQPRLKRLSNISKRCNSSKLPSKLIWFDNARVPHVIRFARVLYDSFDNTVYGNILMHLRCFKRQSQWLKSRFNTSFESAPGRFVCRRHRCWISSNSPTSLQLTSYCRCRTHCMQASFIATRRRYYRINCGVFLHKIERKPLKKDFGAQDRRSRSSKLYDQSEVVGDQSRARSTKAAAQVAARLDKGRL